MSRLAVLLLDLQVDFLDGEAGRMPVSADDAVRIIHSANAILSGSALGSALPVIIVNQFPVTDRILNFFRKGAAISGTSGAAIDGRIAPHPKTRVFAKSSPSAFSNAELEPFLRENAVNTVCVMGVFAEGCVRATALDAKSRGFRVVVSENAIATNSTLKMAFALWALRRGGITIVPTLSTVENAT
jgi:nicotinamidase-related amidase